MARIASVDIPKNKRGVVSLTYIFGIGPSRSKEILLKANIDVNKDGITTADEVQTTEKAGVQCPNKPGCTGCKCSKNVTTSSADQKKCASCANAKWWKFWEKKKNCCNTKT